MDDNEPGRQRYIRQIGLISKEGQERLGDAKVFILGIGGLGSVISVYLTVAGVGNLTLVDFDTVDATNLNRQILYDHSDIGRLKTEIAKKKLERINENVQITAVSKKMNEKNAEYLINDSDLIIDASDNIEARYALNKVAIKEKVPIVHGAVSAFYGQVTMIMPGETPCLRCIYPKNIKKTNFSIIGSTCGIIGSIQATEAVKYITNKGDLIKNKLLVWDGFRSRFDEIKIEKNPLCEDCGVC